MAASGLAQETALFFLLNGQLTPVGAKETHTGLCTS